MKGEDAMKFKPVNGHILVQFDHSKTLANGITIKKDTAGRKDLVFANDVYKNKLVGFPFYAATRVVIDGKEYFIINEQDILIEQT
jgi:co-chaperonin GroES (HSP10)